MDFLNFYIRRSSSKKEEQLVYSPFTLNTILLTITK